MDRLTGPGWLGLYLVVAVCVLLFVPLGLGALGRGERLARWWPVAAGPAVIALALPRGPVAGLLCLPYLLACLAVPAVLWRDRLAAFAAACLPVAAAGLMAERADVDLLGFSPGVLGLTAAHFHVAGFGALLLLTLAGERGWTAPTGVAVVGLGFLLGRTPLGETVGDAVELIGAGLLTAGLWWAIGTRAAQPRPATKDPAPGSAPSPASGPPAGSTPVSASGPAAANRRVAVRALFGLSVVTMSLAVLYAAGQVLPIPHLGLTWMVLTHGVLNTAAVLTALVVAWAAREQRWTRHVWTHRIGTGRERFELASAALLTWHMHRRSAAWVDPATPPAFPGLEMRSSLGFGRFRVPEPCRVTEVVREPGRTVMHYLALPGHTFEGDESFTVLREADGTVLFRVDVRSRPVLLIARLADPLVPVAQRLFVARCASVLRRCVEGDVTLRSVMSDVQPGAGGAA